MSPQSHDTRRRQQAARWYARLQAVDCTAEERAAFEAWRAEDPSNAAAYAAAERVADALASLTAASPRMKAMLDAAAAAGATLPDDPQEDDAAEDAASASPSEAPQPRSAPRRKRSRRWAAAAAVAAAAVAGVVAIGQRDGTRRIKTARAALQYVATDARREVVLDDGTRVDLDVGSAIEVRFAPERREVVLVHGRALFSVAHDASRPFTVAAGAGCVTALGTVFQVDRTAARVTVTLAQGSVRVASASTGGPPAMLAPGEELSFSPVDRGWRKRAVDARAATSWAHGRLVFRATPLGDAVREVNRYAQVRVRLADPTLAPLLVSGSFSAGDSRAIVAAFAAVLPIEPSYDDNEIQLRRSARPSP